MAPRLLKTPLVAALLLAVWCGAPTAAQEGELEVPQRAPLQHSLADAAPEPELEPEPDPVSELELESDSEPLSLDAGPELSADPAVDPERAPDELLDELPDELSDELSGDSPTEEAIEWEDADHSPLDQEVEEEVEEEDSEAQSDQLSYRSPLIWLPLLALSWIVLMRLARSKRVDLGGDGYSHYLSHKGRKEADRQRSAARCDKRPGAF